MSLASNVSLVVDEGNLHLFDGNIGSSGGLDDESIDALDGQHPAKLPLGFKFIR
jgi:hypothetical protein